MTILPFMSVVATALLWRFARDSTIIRKAPGEEGFEVVPAMEQAPPQPISLIRQFNQC